jgi:glycosyltransferase involved in cell wall biosynthesis
MNIISSQSNKKLAFLIPDLIGGGTQRVVLNLIKGLVKYQPMNIDLVVINLAASPPEESFINQIPAPVKIIDLNIGLEHRFKSYIKIILALIKYLNQEKPHLLLSNIPLANFLTIIAQKVTIYPLNNFVIEHSFFLNDTLKIIEQNRKKISKSRTKAELVIPLLMRWLYPQAKGIIAVSKGLAEHIEKTLNLSPDSVKVIYNPVIDEELLLKSEYPIDNDWINPKTEPVFLAVGRLSFQKDYETLLKAFAKFRENNYGKLLILGEGELREKLENLIKEMQLNNDVQLLGFTDNPYAYMSKVDSLILSSLWEGLPTVLIEAMACGCQVIATDCPYGAKEILAAGEYGFLVPTQDILALAKAMEQVLISPKNPEKLRRRAKDFTVEKAVTEYLSFIGLN